MPRSVPLRAFGSENDGSAATATPATVAGGETHSRVLESMRVVMAVWLAKRQITGCSRYERKWVPLTVTTVPPRDVPVLGERRTTLFGGYTEKFTPTGRYC